MQQVFICLYVLFGCVFTIPNIAAIAPQNQPEAKNDLRILNLLPNLLCPLAVDPGVPADFIALSPSGTLDPYDWIYWGPKDVLEAYFKEPSSLQEPIVRVKLSANVAQTGSHAFNNEESLKLVQKKYPKGFASTKAQWGDYPIVATQALAKDYLDFVAWVGLNDPEAGWTLIFNLVYPNKQGHPNEKDRQLWEHLLMGTTPLKDGDYFKACGQDLQEGYTLVNAGGAKLKMLAEKRQSDGTLQVVAISESPNIAYRYIDMMEGFMGAKWKYGEPLVKVRGEITATKGNSTFITNHVTSIFVKNVPEFSITKDYDKYLLAFQKKCDPED